MRTLPLNRPTAGTIGPTVALFVVVTMGRLASAQAIGPAAYVELSPLEAVRISSGGLAVVLQLDEQRYRNVKRLAGMTLRGYVAAPGRVFDLNLEQFFVTDGRTRWVRDGEISVAAPDVVLLRGEIDGQPESHVFLALSPHGSNGYIQHRDELYILTTYAPDPRSPRERITVSYAVHDFPPLEPADWSCEVRPAPGPGGLIDDPQAASNDDGGGVAYGNNGACVEAVVAIETDYQLFQRFGGQNAANAYLLGLVGAVSDIFERDANIKLVIGFSRLWTTADDPYETSTFDEFRDYWNENMTHVQRHAAHMISRQYRSGGVAYLPGLCNTNFDYALSGVNGAFPQPPISYRSNTWDLFVVAHEWGHNFGTPHTHDYRPPIDICASDCSVTNKGTIMSYCHTCWGGMTNILLGYHRRVQAVIVNHTLGTGCLTESSDCETILRGDMNCDGSVDGADIDPFFLALGDPSAYQVLYPNCDRFIVGDVDANGGFDGSDIWGFFRILHGDPP